MRECGTCHTCCVLPPIEALNKHVGVKCEHVRQNRHRGCCNIYKTRPGSCRTFNCAWRTSPEMPDEFRPDRSGIMLTVSKGAPEDLQIWEDTAKIEDSPLLDWLEETGATKIYSLVRVFKRKEEEGGSGD